MKLLLIKINYNLQKKYFNKKNFYTQILNNQSYDASLLNIYKPLIIDIVGFSNQEDYTYLVNKDKVKTSLTKKRTKKKIILSLLLTKKIINKFGYKIFK